MIKRLLNLNKSTRIITILLITLLLLPQSVMAEDSSSYGIVVAGTPVTADNKDDILNDGGKVSFNVETNTLTLNNATINVLGGGYAIESNIDNLSIYLEGNSEITCTNISSDDKGAFKFTGSNSQAKVTFNTNTSDYNDFGSLIVYNIYSMSQFFSGYTAGNDKWFNNNVTTEEKDGWYYTATENPSNTDPVKVKYRKYYDLWFGYKSNSEVFYRLNSDREGDYFTFNAAESILSYDYYEPQYVFKSSLHKLTVEVNEDASLSQFIFSPKDDINTGELAFSIDPGAKLTLENNNGVILGFSSVTFENGTTVTSPSSSPTTWDASITSATITGPESYNIRIGNIPISELNANDVLGDGGTVKYDNSKHTLTLNNANIDLAKDNNGEMPTESPGIDYQGDDNLIIQVIGTNKIISSGGCDVIQCSSILDIRPDITLKNGDGNPCSLELEGGSGNIISGFRNISGLSNVGGYGNDLVLVYDKDVYYTQDEGLYSYGSDGTGAPGNPVSNATIATDYHLRIGNVYVTNLNKDNVLSNTSNDGKLSYSPQTNTLSFNGAEILQKISIEQENLTIDLEGNNSITIKDEPESSAIIAETCSLTIKSTSKTGSLTLSSSGGCPLTQGITPTITYPLVSSADINNEQATKATIHPVYPPIFSNTSKTETGINVYIDKDEENGGAGTIKYSIEYADKSTGVTNQEFVSATGISMNKPGILTAWIELDSENKSADIIGKFFGYKQKTIRKVFNGTDAVTFEPEIIPEIEENDNIIVSYQSEGNATVTDNVISMSSFGSSMVSAGFSFVEQNALFTKLNPDTIQVKVIAVPAAPSIPEGNSTFLNTEKITITSTAPSGTTICYKWDDGEDKTYLDKIAIEGSTLSAWVKYQPYADAEPVYSDTISATYTIKTDIADYYVAPIDEITYTGSAVTPTIVVKEANNSDAATLTGGTDYEVSYMKGETTITADQLINVGTYTAVITGKGNFAGTTNQTFLIVKANANWAADSWTAPAVKTDLNYSGEAIDLITAGSSPQGTTIKYYTVFNPESYNYTESTDEEWTTTVPKGTAVGDYAIFYKVEGGDNYEDWGPSEEGIKVTIDKGLVSITAENMTSTYTGEPIDFDKNKVEISNTTISKNGISFKYYVPNTENPEEPTQLDATPTEVGTYNVEIYLEDDNYTAESVSATLTISAKSITNDMVTSTAGSFDYNGSTQAPTVVVKDAINGEETTLTENEDYTISYQQVNGETTTTVTNPTNVGSYNAVVTGLGNYTGSVTKAFSITAQTISGATVTINPEANLVFDGTVKHPAVTKVAIAANEATGTTEKVFSADTDYDVSYSDGCTNVGEYTATVTFKGNYSGTASGTFNITAKSLTGATIATIANQTYSGSEIMPEPVVSIVLTTGAEATTLVKGTDFTYSYANNTNAAKSSDENAAPTVIITGIGNYSGTASQKFTIGQATATITASNQSYGYTGNNVEFDIAKITISPETISKDKLIINYSAPDPNNQGETITYEAGPTEVGTYTVEIDLNDDNYSATPVTATLIISAKSITNSMVTLTADNFEYNGSAQMPTVTVKDGEETLKENEDYAISYQQVNGETTTAITNPTNVGSYNAIVTGMGNYSGTATEAFNITTKALTGATIATIADQTYTGSEIKPEPAVSIVLVSGTEATTLVKGTDFEYSYANNTNVPTSADIQPTVTINGKGNYSGTTSANFVINKASITPTVSIEGWTYGATASTPSVSGNTDNGTVTYEYKLQSEAEEKFSTTQPVNAGAYTIRAKIAETANYAAATTDSIHFAISKASITPTVSIEGWTYGTAANTPSVTGNSGNGAVTYTYKAEGAQAFTSEMPTAVGTHTIKATIAETTNYNGGEATSSFTISNPTLDPEKDINFAEGQTFASYYNAEVDAMLPEKGLAAYMITGLEGNTLTIKAISYIPKGTPVLIEKTDANVTIEDPTNVSSNMLKYAEQEVTADGALYILYNGEYVKASGKIPAMKCYLKTTKAAGARRLIIGHNNGDDSTGINAIDNEQTPIDKWYDFNGNRINKPVKKGLYIKNGKKVVVK